MPAAISNHIEVSSFCHATSEPAVVDRVRSTRAIGRAMTAVLDAHKALQDALAADARFGDEKAQAMVDAIDVLHLWDEIDAGLSQERGKAA